MPDFATTMTADVDDLARATAAASAVLLARGGDVNVKRILIVLCLGNAKAVVLGVHLETITAADTAHHAAQLFVFRRAAREAAPAKDIGIELVVIDGHRLVPHGNAMSPPKLAANAPVLKATHPVLVNL